MEKYGLLKVLSLHLRSIKNDNNDLPLTDDACRAAADQIDELIENNPAHEEKAIVNCSVVHNGTMFVGTDRGLYYYDQTTEELKLVPHAKEKAE